jgi:hydrogenase maturation protein HypF
MIEARHIRVTGTVQGVGFRPFVWRLAQELALTGWVRNDASGVEIEAEGEGPQLDQLLQRLRLDAPPRARVDEVREHPATPRGAAAFTIVASGGGTTTTPVAEDTGLCADCLAELFDPQGRRWRHPFITCTHCGPRYTLTRRIPYDRANTSMGAFPLCDDCAREYADPADRRYHAEPTCCPHCGPQLRLVDATGQAVNGVDPIAATLARLRAGEIVAIKGLGGFHLACDARHTEAVARLRQRKQREAKPFAVMAAHVSAFAPFARWNTEQQALLESPERPVVLLPKNGAELPGIAPGMAWLGALLPATPIQWLLFHEAAGRPAGTGWLELPLPNPLLLVMTSANPGGEPLLIDNADALECLAGIADAFLLHDRDIVARCDDSVMRWQGHGPTFLRRARGYTPRPIKLAAWTGGEPGPAESVRAEPVEASAPFDRPVLSIVEGLRANGGRNTPPAIGINTAPPILALGAGLKNTVCLTRGDEAFVSAHIGDLDSGEACRFLDETVDHLCALLDVQPAAVACDLHPDFYSSHRARALAEQWDVPLIAVQHHHAHLAAIAAEHGLTTPFVGLALDGFGLGDDGTLWGGELLQVDGARYQRLGHLAPLALPGGDRAAREPWRMAAAALHRLGRGGEIAQRFAAQPLAGALPAVLERPATPLTTSLGRYFDAAAGLLGLHPVSQFEGQAAMALEGCGARHPAEAEPWRDGWTLAHGVLDLLPSLAHLADLGTETALDDAQRNAAAARFHATLVAALADWVRRTVPVGTPIAFAGGCFLNGLLTPALHTRLVDAGYPVLTAHHLPPNDGGLSLGQAWIARHRITTMQMESSPCA